MTTYAESEERSTATLATRIRSWFTGRAKFAKEMLRAVEEARSASVAAREASGRAAEAAAETQAAILKYLGGAATEAKEGRRDACERELGRLLCAYFEKGRWCNISIPMMLQDLDDETREVPRGVLLAVDTILAAYREGKNTIRAGSRKVLMDYRERALESLGPEDDCHHPE